jgi:16S rRNA (uracil1498-N3)-methyltransferase
MNRFYVLRENLSEDKVVITDEAQIHHLKNVLRCKQGEKILILDSQGDEYLGVIERVGSRTITLTIKQRVKSSRKGSVGLTVACAIPKGNRMDDIVDKFTQLGVDNFIPLETERVVVKWDDRKMSKHLKRWNLISLNASQQSGRCRLMSIHPKQALREVISKKGDYDLKLIPTLSKDAKKIKDVLIASKANNVLILIGPEGDFTPGEISLSKKAGFIPVSLGKLVLRVETAAVAVASFIRFYEDN